MRALSTFALLLIGGSLLAQEAVVTDIIATPNYFMTVLTGVIIAAGIQFFLTALSVAIGVSATPNLKKSYVGAKYGSSDSNNDNSDWNEYDDTSNTGVMVSSALGVWNLLTVGLSLFAATAIALNLSAVVNSEIALALSLTIWALFFLLMFYLEGRAISTTIGGLINTAVSGLKATGEAVKQMFTPSPTSEIQKVADNTIEKVRKEFNNNFDSDKINEVVNNFMDRVENTTPSYSTLKADLKEIVKQGKSGGGSSPATWTAIQGVVNKMIDENGSNKNMRAKLEEIANQLKSETGIDVNLGGNNGNSTGENDPATQEAMKERGKKFVTEFKEWVNNATPEKFDANQLETQLTELYRDPQGKLQQVRQLAGQLDRDTIVETISSNTQLDREKVENYASQVENALQTINSKIGGNSNGNGGQSGVSLPQNIAAKVESAIAGFINGTDDPRLNYNSLKRDVLAAIDNPQDSLNIIKRRVDTFDRDTLISVLTNNDRINRSDIDRIAGQVESANNQVKDKIQQIEDGVRSTYQKAERRAVIQAEHLRKTSIAAAWWLVATCAVSAAAAVAGGMIGF